MKVLGHYVYLPIALLAVTEFGIAAAVFTTVDLGWRLPSGTLEDRASVAWALTYATAILVGLTSVGLYQAKQRLRIEGVFVRVVVGTGIAAILVALVNLFSGAGLGGPRWAWSFAATLLLLIAVRGLAWRWFEHDVFQRRVLVYGAGRIAASLLKLRRRSDRRGFQILAVVPAEGDESVHAELPVKRLTSSLLEFAKANDVDEIVIAMDDRRRGFPIGDLLACRLAGIAVVEILSFLERETGKVNVDLVNPSWLIFSEGFSVKARVEVLTRILDVTVSMALLVIGSPVLLLVAAAVALDDGFPVLYRQRRVGKGGAVFTLLKFRSMVRNAEAAGVPQWARTGDSRVTRVGGLLRKLRLDELPQLFNVVKGDMALVGPRPERPEFVERLSREIPYYQERHVVKPGITGWAQLSYPYGASDRDALEKLQYDLYYIKHKSLVFDLIVLLQTAEVVLWGKGAR
jgi:sugar transferase (PEP-CTERM system associated)